MKIEIFPGYKGVTIYGIKFRDKIVYVGLTTQKVKMRIYSHFKNAEVLCVENNTTYESVRHAAKALGLSERAISNQVRGDQKTVKGLTFKGLKDATECNMEWRDVPDPTSWRA